MTILWLVNITMPDACEALGLPKPVIGGWLSGYRDALLSAHPEVSLHFVSPYSGSSAKNVTTDWNSSSSANSSSTITHHLFPRDWQSEQLCCWLKEVNEAVNPDIIHLHGTEYPHSLAWVEACGSDNVLVSIQGLTSVYAKYYMAGMTEKEQRPTFNDLRFHRSLAQMQQKLIERGNAEIQLLLQAQHVAGRTIWDKSHVWAINPSARYHKLQEVLRNEFYDENNRWSIDKCHRHSIFVSQGHYPLKGLHKLLEAMPLVARQYPDAEIYVIGDDITQDPWWRRSAYANVLRHRISEAKCKIHFLRQLSADQMCEQYKLSHVFVCPSAIENSSNSVCEAQLLGCPVVASYVGGLMDLVKDGQTGLLYRFEETEMLAEAICRIFSDDDLAKKLGSQARQAAMVRHDRRAIADNLYNIYSELTHGC